VSTYDPFTECGVVHLTLADREDDGQDAEKEKEEENNTPEVQPDTTFAALESDNIESIIDTSERRTATMKPHKEFSWDAPFPAHIDAESAKRLTEGALRNFDEKYRRMTTSKAEVTATNVTKMESKGRRDVRLFIMIMCGLVRLSREESERGVYI